MQFDTIHLLTDAEIAVVAMERLREVADNRFLLQIMDSVTDECAKAGRELNVSEKIIASLRKAYYLGCTDGLHLYNKSLRSLEAGRYASG